MPVGTVLNAVGGIYEVQLQNGELIEAVLRGRLKRDDKSDGQVVAGDIVTLSPQDDGSFAIETISPRRSQLARKAPGAGRARQKVIAANLDQVVIVFAGMKPEPNSRMLDRFLILAEANDIPALIVVNKVDLVPGAQVEAFLAPYERAGYATLKTAAKAGVGVEELRSRLCNANSALTGPSGVGKSSLLNAVQPGLGLRIGEVSAAMNKGTHTTVSARLIPLECGGYVADTPGLKEVGMWGIEAEDFGMHFPEFRALIDDCRFGGSCSHTHEPKCAVRSAVESCTIATERYESYCKLYEECQLSSRGG
ncbi:MAG: ribosome small subunit-dependent GTPase A [Longimicrobiales bacterium]